MEHREYEKNLARFLYCSSILEGRVADAYKHLASRVENFTVRSLLQYIVHDTLKHSEVLKDLGRTLAGIEVFPEECEKIWGDSWKTVIKDSLQGLSEKDRVTNKELAVRIEAMKSLEGYFAEEYLTVLHAETSKFLVRQHSTELGNYNTVLEWIVEDEKRHSEILTMIKNVIVEPPPRAIVAHESPTALRHKMSEGERENEFKGIASRI